MFFHGAEKSTRWCGRSAEGTSYIRKICDENFIALPFICVLHHLGLTLAVLLAVEIAESTEANMTMYFKVLHNFLNRWCGIL